MSDHVQVQLLVTMPMKYLQEFLQRIRDFETQDEAHDKECAFMIAVDASNAPTEEMRRILESIRPPFKSGVAVNPRK